MYYRRKILLALIQAFDNKLDEISLQKLLLLYTKQQSKPAFHFVPYKYGCFSFQANADLNTMTKYKQVSENCKIWQKTDAKNYIGELIESDRKVLRNIKSLYDGKSKDELILITYQKYPYFTINSTIAESVLNADEYQSVVNVKPQQDSITLFTIGYQGKSLEEYLNKLIINNVKVLCDVRKNPLSMKYGFSKSQLRNACDGVGIQYIHIPDFGIDSDKRQELNCQADYDKLFLHYRQDTLSQTRPQQEQLMQLLKKERRVALTCFEANINECHRKHLAEEITSNPAFKYNLQHI